MRLKDKVAIITGGSRGIGRSIVKAFLQNGARVTIGARSISEIDNTVKDLRTEGEIIGVVTDVSREKDVRNLVEQTVSRYGDIDILINAAGIQGPIGPLVEVDIEEWINNIHINLIGTVLCCKHVLPTMINKRRGKVINFSGGGSTSPRPNFSAYACSKTAVVRFTETLAEEVRDFNIQVNAIAPGAVNTKMLEEILAAGEKAGNKEFIEAKKRLKEGGTSPEIAASLAVFLASDESNGITGKLISAPWDPWQDKTFIEKLNIDKDLATLRRIDDRTFFRKG